MYSNPLIRMSLSMKEISEIANIIDIQSEEQLRQEAVSANHLDKFYVAQNNTFQPCKFCDDFYPRLLRCACGCLVCSRCLYTELPQIPLARCPYCSFSVEYDKQIQGSCVYFDFNPIKQSMEEQKLRFSSKFQIAELHPAKDAGQVNKNVRVLCRFHEAISPYDSRCNFCCQVTDDGMALLKEHIRCCQNTQDISGTNKATVDDLNNQDCYTSFQIRQDLLSYENQFVTEECKQLFSKNYFTNGNYHLSPHRCPLVPHLFVRKLLLESQQEENNSILDKRPDFWNFQLIIFQNPYEPQEIKQYDQIILGLRISTPDSEQYQEFQFNVKLDQLKQQKILRFFGRQHAKIVGAYTFDVRLSMKLNDQLQFQTRKTFVKYVNFQQLSKIKNQENIQQWIQNQNLQSLAIIEKLSQAIQTVDEGLQFARQKLQEEDESSVLELNIKELENIFIFGTFSVSVRDVAAFIIALKGFAYNTVNARVIVAMSFFDVITEQMDRFAEQYIIQRSAVDLLYQIVQSQGDMNILSLKVPGLFGRLRRAKQILQDHSDEMTEMVDKLLDGLFRVSIKSFNIQQKEQEQLVK